MSTDPDVVKSLAAGGLTPDDIDYVILSPVHWDHVGEPRDFPTSQFIIGSGGKNLLQGSPSSLRGGHSLFEADLLPEGRTQELSDPSQSHDDHSMPLPAQTGRPNFHAPWTAHPSGVFPYVLDIFQDGSMYIVDAPGHLPGHINILAKTGASTSVYLGGDACHDRRITRKEKEIGTWPDAEGHVCYVDVNREMVEQTMERISKAEGQGVEVILAHDVEWERDAKNRLRFWGAK